MLFRTSLGFSKDFDRDFEGEGAELEQGSRNLAKLVAAHAGRATASSASSFSGRLGCLRGTLGHPERRSRSPLTRTSRSESLSHWNFQKTLDFIYVY